MRCRLYLLSLFLARYRKYLVVLSIAMLPLLLPFLYLYYARRLTYGYAHLKSVSSRRLCFPSSYSDIVDSSGGFAYRPDLVYSCVYLSPADSGLGDANVHYPLF